MKPICHNRAPHQGRWHATGRIVQTGERIDGREVWTKAKPVYRWHPVWFVDRCVVWDGTGIGQPTEKYPSGTPYPLAHKWDCRGCRWLPEQHKEDAGE